MQFPFFKLHILVNTAQISINFYSQMLAEVLITSEFTDIAARFGNQFLVSEIYCPFISYQANYLPLNAHQIINEADAVYVKGANFFETCQIPQKPVFHAFVVYGPVSRKYTGLNDNDGVFALVPAGKEGYVHHRDPKNVITLRNVVAESCKISPA